MTLFRSSVQQPNPLGTITKLMTCTSKQQTDFDSRLYIILEEYTKWASIDSPLKLTHQNSILECKPRDMHISASKVSVNDHAIKSTKAMRTVARSPITKYTIMSDVGHEDAGRVNTLSWPPTSQTVKLMFLYSTVSTLNPASNEVLAESHKVLIIRRARYYIIMPTMIVDILHLG
ncbi:hypothetical protein VIGAN_08193300 [Vigna angularis var. angularis]|uniref:Uncharacterized protein n=1 Tax=Vigna angularis var. angularis TaxID=157739 RepID=A0A0S3SQZ2_PHAAN|nr:hypothetical protein VIGAN_08193300 [Vigna angularis var. angularis]